MASTPDRYGTEPSEVAIVAATLFADASAARILELGGGQGRDTIFFAREGLEVDVLDFAPSAVRATQNKAASAALGRSVRALVHDVRKPLPFADATFDACYSHMLWCAALTTAELHDLSGEVWRVLRPGGLCVYSVRSTLDPECESGTPVGDGLQVCGGFEVRFFEEYLIGRLAAGRFTVESVGQVAEGPLPRRLLVVVERRRDVVGERRGEQDRSRA